jgi:hypothetical protein
MTLRAAVRASLAFPTRHVRSALVTENGDTALLSKLDSLVTDLHEWRASG